MNYEVLFDDTVVSHLHSLDAARRVIYESTGRECELVAVVDAEGLFNVYFNGVESTYQVYGYEVL